MNMVAHQRVGEAPPVGALQGRAEAAKVGIAVDLVAEEPGAVAEPHDDVMDSVGLDLADDSHTTRIGRVRRRLRRASQS